MSEVVAAYIGLGSNLDQPSTQVQVAIRELGELPGSVLERASSLYESAPLGPQDQPDFVNAVVRLKTSLAPELLLDALQRIEQRHGRIRAQHWGPRSLDLDILLYGDRRVQTSRLRIPHPQLARRNFVLCPLAEIAAGLTIPGLGSVADLLVDCPSARLKRLPSETREAG
jgi:2-amino-4-hydroxy-6-hydroxymethyldihydropteridine diphosphokinase